MNREKLIETAFLRGWQGCAKMLHDGGTDLSKEDTDIYAAKLLLETIQELKEDYN